MELFNKMKGLTGYIICFALSLLMILTLPESAFIEDRLCTTIVFVVYVSIYLLFISEKGKSIIERYYSNLFLIPITVLVLINLSYILMKSAFSTDFFLKSIIVFTLPIIFLIIRKEQEKFRLVDIFILIIPLCVVLLKITNVKLIAYQDTISFEITYSYLIMNLLFIFVGYRRIDIGLNFRINLRMLGETLFLALLLIIINVIIGLGSKFVSFPQYLNFNYENLILYSIFMLLFATLSEEIFFRGLLLNYIKRFTGKYGNTIALILSSIIFGATHLGKFAVSMFLLATIAGIFYGLVYIRTKNLMCAAIIHTIINLCWKLFFITN